MAANSEANLSSDFDIDEVINWDEQNYSSKGIDFQLGLPGDGTKTSQHAAVTLANLGSAVVTSQGAQNSNAFYSALFGVGNNPSVVQNSKNHGFPSRQAMVSQDGLSFPSENISIPSIATSSSSLLQFAPNLVGQNSSLAGQLCMSQMQNVQNSDNMINDDVSPFDDNDDLIEGPLDRIVDQIMDRESIERITEAPPLSSSYDDDTPVITYSNIQAKSSQLPSGVSPQNVPSRSVLSPNAPSRNVTMSNVPSPNMTMRNSPPNITMRNSPPNITMRSSPSPNVPTIQVSSPNPPRNAQNITSTKIITPNISPPNVPSQNIPSTLQNNSHSYPTIQGLSSQSSEQSVPSQTHSKFRLQSPVTISSSMVNPQSQSGPPALKPITNMSMSQTELSTNSLFQSNSGQKNNQSYPDFMLQSTNQTLIQQPSGSNFSQSNMQPKQVWQESTNSLEDLLRMQKSIRTSSPSLEQAEFTNQLASSSPNFSSVLTSKIPGNEHSHSGVQSLLATNMGSESSTSLFPNVSNTTSDLHLKISSPNPVGVNLNGQNIITSISHYNRTSDSNPKSVSTHSQNYPAQAVSNFSGNRVPPSLTGGQDVKLQITSTVQAIQNPATQTLASPRLVQQHTSVNQFFQNSSNVIQSTADMNRNDIFSSVISQPRNVIVSSNQNLSQAKPVTQSNASQQSKSVFTLFPTSTILSPTLKTPPMSSKNEPNPASSKPAGITTIKITSPSLNSGFKYPTVGFSPNPPPKAVSMQPPRTTTIRLKSPTTAAFPTFRLTQSSLSTSSSTPSAKPMVFTLAPGAQATLKGLPINFKDKLIGRQVILVQQPPSGQTINTAKPQPVKIAFVSDGSIKQVVSGPVKPKVPQISASASVISQMPGLAATSSVQGKINIVQESEAGSPSSINSTDSESIPIAALKQTEALKRNESESKDEQKARGKKRRKDPNRPVKPLSSFQRFFQATQPTIRQQNPQITFAEVSKTIKEMWDGLAPKDKKVYQDAWRMDRVQYKKAMDDYNATLSDSDSVDAPVAKQTKVIEIKDEISATNPIPAKTENPIAVSPSTASIVVSIPPPRSSGKPLAMMAEMANKSKLASAHAAKVTAMTKSLHLVKNKASNGVEDSGSHVLKKKAKINPIPKKLCIRAHCNKPAKTTKERGTMFCSDDCLMRYCRGVFRSWVDTRRQTLKAVAT